MQLGPSESLPIKPNYRAICTARCIIRSIADRFTALGSFVFAFGVGAARRFDFEIRDLRLIRVTYLPVHIHNFLVRGADSRRVTTDVTLHYSIVDVGCGCDRFARRSLTLRHDHPRLFDCFLPVLCFLFSHVFIPANSTLSYYLGGAIGFDLCHCWLLAIKSQQ